MIQPQHPSISGATARYVSKNPFAVVEIRCQSGKRSKGHSPIGAAAMFCHDGIDEYHWMAIDTSFDDLARGLMIQHLLQNVSPKGNRLSVWSKGLERTLSLMPGARLRGGYKSGKDKNKKFLGFEVFDPLENSERYGEWTLVNFKDDEEPAAYQDVARLARAALRVAEGNTHLVDAAHREQHGWALISSGRLDNPDSEIDVSQ